MSQNYRQREGNQRHHSGQTEQKEVSDYDYVVPKSGAFYEHDDRDSWTPRPGARIVERQPYVPRGRGNYREQGRYDPYSRGQGRYESHRQHNWRSHFGGDESNHRSRREADTFSRPPRDSRERDGPPSNQRFTPYEQLYRKPNNTEGTAEPRPYEKLYSKPKPEPSEREPGEMDPRSERVVDTKADRRTESRDGKGMDRGADKVRDAKADTGSFPQRHAPVSYPQQQRQQYGYRGRGPPQFNKPQSEDRWTHDLFDPNDADANQQKET